MYPFFCFLWFILYFFFFGFSESKRKVSLFIWDSSWNQRWAKEVIKILWACFPEFSFFFDLLVIFGSLWFHFHSSSHKDGIALVNSLCPEPQQLKPHPGLSDRRSVRGRKKKQQGLAPSSCNRNSKFWESYQTL